MDAEVEPVSPAEAEWVARQRRWTQGWLRFVLPSGEDSAQLSFAGQYDSYLNVSGVDDVAARVRDCWASAYSAR